MNDRYLYRAKRIDNGEWVEGDLVHSVYKINDICVGKYGNEVGMHQVDESTICQCTGLKDKNGKLIWENDIVKIGGVVYICFWNESNFEWGFKNNAEDFGVAYVSSDEINVIGSVIDNPELLEVGE